MSDLDDLRERVDELVRDLSDLAYERLRAAADGDDASRAAAVAFDKRLGRARRALEKAGALLATEDGDGIDPE